MWHVCSHLSPLLPPPGPWVFRVSTAPPHSLFLPSFLPVSPPSQAPGTESTVAHRMPYPSPQTAHPHPGARPTPGSEHALACLPHSAGRTPKVPPPVTLVPDNWPCDRYIDIGQSLLTEGAPLGKMRLLPATASQGTFWGSSWGVPSTWRAPQRRKGPRTSPQTRLQWLTRQVGMLAKSPPLCPCERETQTLNHWLLPQLWLRCCCCYVSLSPPKPSLCMSFPTPRLSVALGGSGWLWMAL